MKYKTTKKYYQEITEEPPNLPQGICTSTVSRPILSFSEQAQKRGEKGLFLNLVSTDEEKASGFLDSKAQRKCLFSGFVSTGKDPRKGWRIPLNEIKYNEQRDEETGYGYFGARYMDHELMTMWLSVDPMSDKYPSISPYAYCAWNPIKLIDPDGNEGIIVSGSPGNHNNKLHFLENGLDRAKQCREYNKKSGEQSTWIIYNDPENQTSKDVISRYSKEAKKLGINVMVVDNVDDITDYINNKDGNGSREKDKISRFYYVGHATPGDLDVGFAGSGENFDPGDLKASAFRSGAYVDVVGGCRTAVADRILFGAITVESSVVDQFAKILDKKSMVVGSDVRVHYNGGVMTNRQLLAENKGREVKKHGRL